MEKKFFPKTISARMFLMAGIFFFAAGILVVILVNSAMRKQAILEAESKARILLDRNLATHSYFTHHLKPALFELTETMLTSEDFEPIWMSSTYAIRKIEEFFTQLTTESFYYKECAINARSPENEADPFEREFIEDLNSDPKLEQTALIRAIGGEPFFQVLRRGEIMEQSCIRCHGVPARAPGDLVKLYGDKLSFHRKVGEVASAISIRIPLQKAYENANEFSAKLSILLILVLSCLYLLLHFLNKKMVFQPLDFVRNKAHLISEDLEHLGEKIPEPEGEELRQLARAFNLMSTALAENRERLEERVRDRTLALKRLNEQLYLEIEVRKSAELAIRESEEKYRSMMEAITDPVFICSRDLRIEYMNPAMIRRVGKEAIGKPCHEVINARASRCPDCQIQQAAKGERFFTEIVSKMDGRRYHISHAPVFHTDGSVSKLSIYRDITDIRKMETELLRSRKLQAIGVLAGGIAHDFSNLITIIMGNLELTQDELEVDSRQYHHLAEAQKACKKATELIRKFLIFSKGFITEKQAFDLKTLFPELSSGVPDLNKWPLEFELADPLPELLGNRALVVTAIRNVLENAIESMPNGGTIRIMAKTVRVDDNHVENEKYPALPPGQYMEISVVDNGWGIAPEHLEKVFDPYYTTKELGVRKGMGFGLSIVYAVVTQHGGRVQIQSTPGKGTTVTIYLPVSMENSANQ